jgi:pimeloyl-ACP methyl ester carboxylesterase
VEHQTALRDGRKLRWLECGNLAGRPVFVLHGSPGSRLLYRNHVSDAGRRGLRLIAPDRPGYGGSTSRRGRSVLDDVADVVAIADEIGLDRFAVWGHSGGGPRALACAATLPNRIVAAASLASAAPVGSEGLHPTEGWSESHISFFNKMKSDPAAWEAGLAEDAKAIRQSTPEEVLAGMLPILSEPDLAACTPTMMDFFTAHVVEGLRPGIEGWRDDFLAGAAPWGFELSSIQVPLQLWHGREDKIVPFSHGEWLSTHIEDAEIHLESGEGHVSIFENAIPVVHEWLSSHF